MTIAVFIDTNILMSDYKMEKQEFGDFLEAHEELNKDENFQLYITEMNLHEVVQNYSREVNSVTKKLGDFSNELNKISDIILEDIDKKKLKEELNIDFRNKIENLFMVYKPSKESYEKAVNRGYENKMPFRDNKSEFKDAVIWESLYDYALKHPDEKIYFISRNYRDFAVKQKDGSFALHPDYDDLNGQIKYFYTINDFLKEIEYLKVHHFSFQEVEDILEIIEAFLKQEVHTDMEIDIALNDFFSNNHFEADIYEGWGTDYYIEEINSVILNEFDEVLEHEDYFYIPISADVRIGYAVETRNPVYEGDADEEEFMQSDIKMDDFLLNAVIKYNVVTKKVERIEDVNIEYL